MPKHTLVLRFALINVIAIGLVAAAYVQGWLAGFAEPRTWIMSLFIFVVFLWGLIVCGYRIIRLSNAIRDLKDKHRELAAPFANWLERLKTDQPEERTLQASMARMSLANQIGAVRYVANSLVFLGLIGTVIGFIIGLSGIDPAATTDVDKIAPMISELITGMSIALYTTLLGAILNIWLNLNLRIMTDGSVRLLSILVSEGDAHGTV